MKFRHIEYFVAAAEELNFTHAADRLHVSQLPFSKQIHDRMYPNYGDWLLKVCRRVGFKPRIVKEADGAPSALAFVAAGYGLAVVSEPLEKIPAKDVIFRDLCPEDRAWMPVGAVWKPDSLTAPAASKFIDVLAQICGDGNGEVGSVFQGFRQVG
jgi:DNA-binding transcriptional LysR family regulator